MNLFDDAKACDVATFFLSKNSGSMSMIRLMKLMYLAERESLGKRHFPMLGDKLYSMNNGPMLSNTYDLMKHSNTDSLWCKRISKKDTEHNLYLLVDDINNLELLELSRNDLKLLSTIWEKFGHLSASELIEYTHSSACPEWSYPNGSRTPISYKDILSTFGLDKEVIQDILNQIKEEADLRLC